MFYLILWRDETGGKVLALCLAKQEVSMDIHKDFWNFMVSANNYFKEKKRSALVPKSLQIAAIKQLVSLDLKVAS